jgi:hypothetical protein
MNTNREYRLWWVYTILIIVTWLAVLGVWKTCELIGKFFDWIVIW